METLERRYDLFAIVIVFILAMVLEYRETFSMLEDETLGYRQILRTIYADEDLMAPSDDVVIVYTDEEFYEIYDAYPLRRVDLSTLVVNLNKMGAAVIAVDMLFDFKSAYGDDPPLVDAFGNADNILLVSQAEFSESDEFVKVNRAIERFSELTQNAYTNIASNSNVSETIVRLRIHEEIYEETGEWPYAVEAVAMYLGEEASLDNHTLRIGEDVTVKLDQFDDLYIDWPLLPPNGEGGTLGLHDVIGISAADLMFSPDEEELEELSYLVDGKIVLIGEVAEVAHDEFETPVGNVYGVEIIANVISTILKNGPLKTASLSLELGIALIVMLGFLATVRITNPMPRSLLSSAIVVSFIVLAVVMYVFWGIVLSMIYVFMASIVSITLITTRFYLLERGQKAIIRSAFGQYLSPSVVEDLVADPSKLKLGGEEREMTAYFSDIRGFSSFSETMTPTELVAALNDYLTEMCNIIIGYEGTVDKFEGDAIIAFWGAPIIQQNHATLACFASIDMNKALVPLRKKFLDDGRPELYVRMGLNSGPMVVGNMGSAHRMNYTIMGDAVNLASRLEGANKAYASDMMISQMTYDLCKDDVDVRDLDTIRVVGKSEPVKVYQLLERKNQTPAQIADLVNQYNVAMKLYKDRDFADAQIAFRACTKIISDDGPSLTYMNRCKHFIENPPAQDWDGVFNLMDKG